MVAPIRHLLAQLVSLPVALRIMPHIDATTFFSLLAVRTI